MGTFRCEVKHEDKVLAFGYDGACGEFLQVWKRPTDAQKRADQDQFGPEDEDMLVDTDTVFTGMTQERCKALIAEHGFTWEELEAEYNRTHPSY